MTIPAMNPAGAITTTKAATTTTKSTTSSSKSAAAATTLKTTTAAGGAAGTVQKWGQCGGQGYTGPTVCVGSTCTVSSQWYSQCL